MSKRKEKEEGPVMDCQITVSSSALADILRDNNSNNWPTSPPIPAPSIQVFNDIITRQRIELDGLRERLRYEAGNRQEFTNYHQKVCDLYVKEARYQVIRIQNLTEENARISRANNELQRRLAESTVEKAMAEVLQESNFCPKCQEKKD